MDTTTPTNVPISTETTLKNFTKKVLRFFLGLLKKFAKMLLFLHIFLIAIVLLALIVSPFHAKSVFAKSKQITAENGWHHPDEETNFWLHYATGKAKINLELKQKIAMQMVIIEENYNFHREDSVNSLKHCTPEEKYVYFLSVIRDSLPYQKEVCDFMWEYAKKSGSPKIRLVYGNAFTRKRPYQENYNGITNTIYINPFGYAINERIGKKNPAISSIIAEMVHANQYYTDRTRSILRLSWDGYRTAVRALFSGKPFIDTYEKTYHEKGSTEYIAHKIKEVELNEKLEELQKNN